jgi:aspartyl-tRNA(Asn)/glutamyl-tRNA(Gln) amidotransferase subunit A
VTDPTTLDATAAAEQLATGALTAVALTRAYLERIAAHDGPRAVSGPERWPGRPGLNAFITVLAEQALDAARTSDARTARGERCSRLDGVPIALKDNIAVAGVPTTAGMATRRHAVAGHDAEVTRRLREAGAVILGTLNMHEAALGSTTDNPHFGRVANPYRLDHTPGGSSGGSAVAVAARLCAASFGTDTLGSVRLPAAYCGVAGLLPTHGLVSTRGLVPLSERFDAVGPIARSVRDLALLLDVIAGDDPACPESQPPPPGFAGGALAAIDIRALVVGRPTGFDGVPVDDEIRAAWQAAMTALGEMGCRVRDVEIPGYDPDRMRRTAFLVIEADAAVTLGNDLAQRPEHLSPELRGFLEYGARLPATRLVQAERLLVAARAATRRVVADVDVLVLPSAPQTAFPFGTPAPTSQPIYTALASIAGLPAVSVPAGLTRAGLPIGLQLIGPPFGDRTVLALAHALERTTGPTIPPPDLA